MTTAAAITDFQRLLAQGRLVLDGGLATALEQAGHDLSGSLWSAALLADAPEEVLAVHRGYVAAGADIVSTASYQASRSGFERAGRTAEQADQVIVEAVSLARESGARFVAASIGPYGATLADGSEYRGDYQITRESLRRFHAERLEVVLSASPDVLAFETVPSLMEVEVIYDLLSDEFTTLPAWLSVSAKDGEHLSDGTPLATLAAIAEPAALVALGVNCTKPEHISGCLQNLAGASVPRIVYPNAGRTWDALARDWLDAGVDRLPTATLNEWFDLGASIIGGCCGLTYDHVADVRAVVDAQ